MSDPGDTAANAPKTREIKAGFVRLLSDRIRQTAADPQQMREIVYELARVKLLEQFTHAEARESQDLQQILERAIEEVERSFKLSGATTRQEAKRSGGFTSVVRLAVLLLLIAAAGIGVASWPKVKTQLAALSQLVGRPPASQDVQPQQATPPAPPQSETAERTPDSQKESAPPAQPSMPLPTTFGVYALSEGRLQELKSVPGKIPDRRVAISAAITAPSATTLQSGDVRFIVFRADGGMDASVTEVRVVAKVSRAMGVDANGKAAMVSAGDAWVIRSMSYPYKVGPVEDQPRMLLLQPEQDGFTLAPGRYVVVVKGMGYDFTVAGTVTDPNQCVERINATNGAFYSPCPPPR
ncbi:hypothetical protein SAMN05216330_110192 [Bradyrhizobium sp. Ghvi]|uniref:hypothetical protein n=1 Tax=Bradyrhizobium sp. Ghvi TaxID=1855319 RepID=UPI0008E90EC5|nr:hypothetical protein [Bradyrhizobium sp. Ghvi]SFP80914.1 hypothetical protein SAMN05216330_110192 [Bradyrhizobium sp. Ghvi]